MIHDDLAALRREMDAAAQQLRQRCAALEDRLTQAETLITRLTAQTPIIPPTPADAENAAPRKARK